MNPERAKLEHITALPPIPQESVEGWRERKIRGLKQDLVPLGPFTDFSDCDTSSVNFSETGIEVVNFSGQKVNRRASLLTHFVRQDVRDCLVRAQGLLPPGYFFKFYDGYRPLAAQRELFDAQRKVVASQHPGWSDEQIDEETHKFIARPAMDEESRLTRPAPHTTGAAIDLRLIYLSEEGLTKLESLKTKMPRGQLGYPAAQKAEIFRKHAGIVDMGAGFNPFGKEAAMNYYETIAESELTPEDRDRRQNRRLMFKVLKQAGLSNYPEEWWHWSFGDQEWAANLKKEDALFGEVDLNEENKAMETARQIAYLHTVQKFTE